MIRTTKGERKPNGLRITVYGIPGSGKTTLASKLRNAVFLDFEKGTYGIECETVNDEDIPRDYTGMIGFLKELKKDHQGFETLVIDSGDKMEEVFDASYSAKNNIESIYSVHDHGQTISMHKKKAGEIHDAILELVNSGMNVLTICHEAKVKIEPREGIKKEYDHADLKMSKGWSAQWRQNSDWLIYVARKTYGVEADKKTGELAHLEGGKLWAFFEPNNDFEAKHRACVKVPEDMPLDKLDERFQSIIDASVQRPPILGGTTVSEQLGIEKAEKKPRKAKKEAVESENVKEEASPKDELEHPPLVRTLLKLVRQYSVDVEKFREYCSGRLDDRYGLNFKTLPFEEWPNDALSWCNSCMEKIVAKYPDLVIS